MDPTIIIILRIIHILAGAIWLGGAVTVAFFLLPTVRTTGPIGGQFAGALFQRHLAEWLLVSGAVSIVAGLVLYWNFYSAVPWDSFGPQVAYPIGGLFAVLALIIGVAIARPTASRLAGLSKAVQAQGSPPTAAQAAQREALLARLASLVALIAVFVGVTAVFMAMGRYL